MGNFFKVSVFLDILSTFHKDLRNFVKKSSIFREKSRKLLAMLTCAQKNVRKNMPDVALYLFGISKYYGGIRKSSEEYRRSLNANSFLQKKICTLRVVVASFVLSQYYPEMFNAVIRDNL